MTRRTANFLTGVVTGAVIGLLFAAMLVLEAIPYLFPEP